MFQRKSLPRSIELGDRVVREGVGVLGAVRVLGRQLGAQGGESVGRLIGDRVGTGRGDELVALRARPGALEDRAAVVRAGLVGAVPAEEHHVDDRLQVPIEEDLERAVRVGLEMGCQAVGGVANGLT